MSERPRGFGLRNKAIGKTVTPAKMQTRQVTGRGPSSRGNARDLKRFLAEFTLSLAEGVEMTKRVSLCAWRPFDFAQDMLGGENFLEVVLFHI